jgi:hypothetical protein
LDGADNISLAAVAAEKLEKACHDIDAGRRKASSNLSKISNVHWEDVGGLDHVRAEIMDAIELPLKHPHLFPKNTGRSGILLFGPPGTGRLLYLLCPALIIDALVHQRGLSFLVYLTFSFFSIMGGLRENVGREGGRYRMRLAILVCEGTRTPWKLRRRKRGKCSESIRLSKRSSINELTHCCCYLIL